MKTWGRRTVELGIGLFNFLSFGIMLGFWYEFYQVDIRKKHDGYPWGSEEASPNYASPDVYVQSLLPAMVFSSLACVCLLIGIRPSRSPWKWILVSALLSIATLLSAAAQSPDLELSYAGLRATISPQRAGRLTSLTFRGHEVLTPPSVDPVTFGNSFWTVPQSVWNWPPPVALDAAPYRLVEYSSTRLVLDGPADTLTGFQLRKEYRLNPADTSLTVAATYRNVNRVPRRTAAWEISRSPKGGTLLVPFGSVRNSMGFDAVRRLEKEGILWLDLPAEPHPKGRKLNLDTRAGWLAYVREGYAFIKLFPNVPADSLHPGEGDAEVYLDNDLNYLELEEQGAFQTVPPGGSFRWESRWLVRKLPEGLNVGLGSVELRRFLERWTTPRR